MLTIKNRKLLYNSEMELLEIIKSNAILSVTDTFGRIIYANDNFCKILRLNQQELIGEAFSLFKSDRHTNPFFKKLWSTIKSGNVWKGELNHQMSNGDLFCFETTIIPSKDNQGNIEKYVALYVDITTCYENSERTVDWEDSFTTFTKNIHNAIISIDRFGRILNVGHQIEHLEVAKVIGNNVYDFIGQESYKTVKKHVDFVFKNGKSRQYETTKISSNGKRFYLTQITPVLNALGRVVSASLSTLDVTKLRIVEENLKKKEAKYNAIFDSLDFGIIMVTDEKGNILEWNKNAVRAFGYSESEIIGSSFTKILSKKHRNSSLKMLIETVGKLKSSNSCKVMEMNGLKKGGEEFPLKFSITGWNEGKNRYYCAMMQNVSDKKSLENNLLQKKKELELFLYRSGHDLKAPFSSATGLIKLIKLEDKSQNLKQLIDMLDTTIEKCKMLIDNLMHASEISGKIKEKQPINFSEIINEAMKNLQGTIHFDKVTIKTNIKVTQVFNSDAELILSLFQNLIKNGIKYSRYQDKGSLVGVEVQTISNGVRIRITDNGLGVSQTNLKKIFDLYYRENRTDIVGTGLGLYIVKNIVQNLDGKLSVTSKINEGTCFNIVLPNPERRDS